MNLTRWYQNLKRGSQLTADVYYYALTKFCGDNNITPEDLLSLEDNDLRNLILDYVTYLESKGRSNSHVATFLKAIKNWLKFNGRKIELHVKLPRERKLRKEKIPTREDLFKILSSANVKERAIISLLAYSGIRPNVIGNANSTDGLRIGDLPELKVENGRVEFEEIPTIIKVRGSLSKAGHPYLTFLTREGCHFLEIYLNSRLMKGEKLSEDSPLISRRGGGFLQTTSVTTLVRGAIRRAGFNFRPYLLRHYFDTQLLLAEANGYLPRDYRVFWMGHKGDIEHEYTTNKEHLPPTLIEDMRMKYDTAGRSFLETGFFRAFEEKESRKPKQKVVKPEEIDYWLEAGYEYVTTLPDGRIIVKRGD